VGAAAPGGEASTLGPQATESVRIGAAEPQAASSRVPRTQPRNFNFALIAIPKKKHRQKAMIEGSSSRQRRLSAAQRRGRRNEPTHPEREWACGQFDFNTLPLPWERTRIHWLE